MSSYLTEKSAKSKEDAIELALAELGVSEDDVEITVIDEGNKGFLGLGSKEAVVKVRVKDAGEFKARNFLNAIFEAMNLKVDIAITKTSGNMAIELSGDNMGIVIGKRGDTLDSLQYLTSLVVNKGVGRDEYVKVSIDTENYREKRNEALITLSNRLADKVARTGKRYTLEPMNPYERRIIHANLQNNESVTTISIGEDPFRKVVISPKNEKPYVKKKRTFKKDVPVQTPDVSSEPQDEDLPMTYPGGGQPSRFNKNKVSSFEEYLAKENGDLLD